MSITEKDVAEVLLNHKKDAEDRRTKSGKYAPPMGVCRVCGGNVVADVSFRQDGRIGGPLPYGHVSGWHCADCKVMYHTCPPPVGDKAT